MIAEVERTAAFLDEVLPGWERNVTRPINFFHDAECLIGQASGSRYGFTKRQFGVDAELRTLCPQWYSVATCPLGDWHPHFCVAWAEAIAARLHPSTDRAWIAAEPLHILQRTLVRDLLTRAGSALTALLAVLA